MEEKKKTQSKDEKEPYKQTKAHDLKPLHRPKASTKNTNCSVGGPGSTFLEL